MTPTQRPLLVGATAADPRNAVTIWNAMRRWFDDHGLPIEYALFSTYDALCRALLDGARRHRLERPDGPRPEPDHERRRLPDAGRCATPTRTSPAPSSP